MRLVGFSLFSVLLLFSFRTAAGALGRRRILHQPLFPESSPPAAADSPPPPPTDTQIFPSPDQPFFPEVPSGLTSDAGDPPPAANNGTAPIATATQPTKPTKKVAIAISVGIVTLGMLSGLAFFLLRHRVKQPGESQKIVGGGSQSHQEESRVPPPSVLYMGTVDPSRRSGNEANGANGTDGLPSRKLNSFKISDRYRCSPELQPLPPLIKPPVRNNWPPVGPNSPPAMSWSDEDGHETVFYTPQASSISNEEGYYTPVSRQNMNSINSSSATHAKTESHGASSVPHSKRTSPKSRFSASSPETKYAIIPSIKQQPPANPPPPPPPLPPPPQQLGAQSSQPAIAHTPKRPKLSTPPPPSNVARLQELTTQFTETSTTPAPPPPPPPPPPLSTLRKSASSESTASLIPSEVSTTPQSRILKTYPTPGSEITKLFGDGSGGASSSGRLEADDVDGAKPKLKPLHWDKVRATSDRATVWDQLESSSFQLNEDMMESLFGCNSTPSIPKEATRKPVFPPVEQQNRVLDPKKSQNIAILLRALNVTRDEVSEALLDGNPESLGAELLETLVKMAPTKEEEIRLRDYRGDTSKLGTAERFLKAVLDIPYAFKRVEAMLYRANFDTEVQYLRKSFQTLEAASEELKNSRLFLKLLEAVLRTGNRMNVGTNRGDARAFKLETLLKLVDIKGTDGKTTLLHFVVQEIIRSEGGGSDSTHDNLQNKSQAKMEEDFKKQGLQVVAGLSRDLGNVKKTAGMDSDVLSSYVSKLEVGLEKVILVLQYQNPNMKGKFFDSMRLFLRQAEEEIIRIKDDERNTLLLVKEVTEYFHGDAAKEEAHPFRIFVIVRDFLSILDQVCKEVGQMQDRTMVGSARSFRISATASLPVLSRYNVRQDTSSDEESSSP